MKFPNGAPPACRFCVRRTTVVFAGHVLVVDDELAHRFDLMSDQLIYGIARPLRMMIRAILRSHLDDDAGGLHLGHCLPGRKARRHTGVETKSNVEVVVVDARELAV